MTDGQSGPRTDRVRFTATADVERLLADAPDIRAALLGEGVPASALSVTADAQPAVLHTNGAGTSGSRPPGTATRLPCSFPQAASRSW